MSESRWDEAGRSLQNAIGNLYASQGEAGQAVKNALHGTWLGHPFHPVAVQFPIGFWASSAVLDILDGLGLRRFRPAADTLLAAGVLTAGTAAASGATDWQSAEGPARARGLKHAALNSAALLLFCASLMLRARGRRTRGKLTSMAALGIASMGAYQGGHMVFKERMGVNHAPESLGAEAFRTVASVTELRMNEPKRVATEGGDIVLVRLSDGSVTALADRCAHLGGPLSEGEVIGECIACPWHGSTYGLRDGHVIDGPSAYAQPALDVRVTGSEVQVRRKREGYEPGVAARAEAVNPARRVA